MQVGGAVAVGVLVFVEGERVVGLVVVVTMQEHALLSREEGKAVVVGRSGSTGGVAVLVIVFRRYGVSVSIG